MARKKEKYKLRAKKRVKSDLRKLPKDKKEVIIKSIESLAEQPFPSGKKVKPIRGASKLYRLRVGDYRVIYEVEKDTVMVLTVLHRRDLTRFV